GITTGCAKHSFPLGSFVSLVVSTVLLGVLRGESGLLLRVTELLLPAENSRLIRGRLGFRYHAFLLIGDRKASVSKDVVGIEFDQSLRDLNRLVQAICVLIGARQAVQRLGVPGIKFQAFLVLGNRFVLFALGEEIEGGIVMVFSLLPGVGHEQKSLAVLNRYTANREAHEESSALHLDCHSRPSPYSLAE